MSISVSTHVLYLVEGTPAAELRVELGAAGSSEPLAEGTTDSDGRIGVWEPAQTLEPGEYWLRFSTGAWFEARQLQSFYPRVEISFIVEEGAHYHVPLLLSPYGYSTYRGS